eukprot:9477385-Pyramimonas_sp.AAC.1
MKRCSFDSTLCALCVWCAKGLVVVKADGPVVAFVAVNRSDRAVMFEVCAAVKVMVARGVEGLLVNEQVRVCTYSLPFRDWCPLR